jgi:hypothetical protein
VQQSMQARAEWNRIPSNPDHKRPAMPPIRPHTFLSALASGATVKHGLSS